MERRESVVQTRFRLRKKLLSQLAREAKRNDRSLNDEVERRLEQSFAGLEFAPILKALEEIAATIRGTAASAGVGAAQAVGQGIANSVGASSGVGTVTGVGAALFSGVAASAGVGTAHPVAPAVRDAAIKTAAKTAADRMIHPDDPAAIETARVRMARERRERREEESAGQLPATGDPPPTKGKKP